MNPLLVENLTAGAVLVSCLMAIGWVVATLRGDAGLVDVLWTYSLGLLAILFAYLSDGWEVRRALLVVIVGIWSVRLGTYILFDRVLSGKEDGRYQALRSHWGDSANRNFFWFFQAQALASLFFSLPFLYVAANPARSFGTNEILGLLLWFIAISGEAISDAQLRAFRNDPGNRGKTCQVGLWRYSRHPNYFFEWLHWWSYSFMLFGAPGFVISLLCPIVMLYSLFKVTGIPHTEAQALRSRGEEYRAYQQRTSVFVPWFPKES